MLGQFLSHNAVRTVTLDEWVDGVCGPFDEDAICHHSNNNDGSYLKGIAATDKTACYVEAVIVDRIRHGAGRWSWLRTAVDWWWRGHQEDPETPLPSWFNCNEDNGEG